MFVVFTEKANEKPVIINVNDILCFSFNRKENAYVVFLKGYLETPIFIVEDFEEIMDALIE